MNRDKAVSAKQVKAENNFSFFYLQFILAAVTLYGMLSKQWFLVSYWFIRTVFYSPCYDQK